MMKPYLVASCVLGLLAGPLAPLAAREFTIEGAEWNDLSQALDITPFYFTLKDDATADQLSIVMEVYKDGQLLQTIPGTKWILGLEEKKPVDLKSAIFLLPPKDGIIKGTIILKLENGGTGKGPFSLPANLIPQEAARATVVFLTNHTPLTIPGKTPLFAELYSPSGNLSSATNLEDLAKYNPGATAVVFSLKAEAAEKQLRRQMALINFCEALAEKRGHKTTEIVIMSQWLRSVLTATEF